MAPTLTDVAKRAGCSSATVSRVLNNTGQVSEETRQAILDAVETVQYRPRRAEAQRAKEGGGGTRLVRVVVHSNSPMELMSFHDHELEVHREDEYPLSAILAESNRLSNSFYRAIVGGMVEELQRWGCRAILMPNRNLMDGAFLDEVNRDAAEGVLLTGQTTPDVDAFLAACERPVVVVDQDVGPASTNPVVTIDNYAGIAQACEHLFALGHREIAFLSGPESNFAYRERETAYRYNMAARSLPVREEWLYRGINQIGESAAWLTERLAGKQTGRPTALLCSNDVLALGVVRAAGAAKVSIPEELSVVGFDDIEPAAAVTPPLTTVRAPTFEMGRQAVRQLMIATQCAPVPTAAASKLRVMPELVVRSSTAQVKPAQPKTGKKRV